MSDALAAAVSELAAAIRELARVVETRAPSDLPQPAQAALERVATAGALLTHAAPTSAIPAEPVSEDPLAAASALLSELFRLASGPDNEDAFERFVALYHTERITPPRAIPTLREFAWRSVRRRLGDYLATTADPATFALARTERTPGAASLRVFVAARGRSATPVAFRPDPERGGRLRITDSSL